MLIAKTLMAVSTVLAELGTLVLEKIAQVRFRDINTIILILITLIRLLIFYNTVHCLFSKTLMNAMIWTAATRMLNVLILLVLILVNAMKVLKGLMLETVMVIEYCGFIINN